MAWREVARADQVLLSVKRFGAKGDGITDDTASVQSAIAALTNGGTVYFPEGRYILSPLTMRKRIRFQGQHQFTTRLIMKAGSNADFIKFDGQSQYCALTDLTVDGNRLNNTSGNAVRILGTSPTITGQPESTSPPTSDVTYYYNQLRNLRITDSPASGLRLDFIAYLVYVQNVYIDRSVGYGIENYSTDNMFTGVNVELSGLANIYETGSSNHWSSIKSVFAGADRNYNPVGGSSAPGFQIDDVVAGTTLVNVLCQDNAGHGFLISNNQYYTARVVLSACWSDRNSLGTAATYNGFHITTSRGVTLSGCEATAYMDGFQNRPLYVDATSRDIDLAGFSYRNQIRPPRIETPDYTWPDRDTLGSTPSTVDPTVGVPSFTRATTAYKPSDLTNAVASGAVRYETGKVGSAIFVEEGTSNLFSSAESQSLAAPTAKSLGAGTYTVSVKAGTGSIALSGGPTGTATLGTARTFTLGSTTSVTFTPTGTVSRCQLEAKGYDTSWHIGGGTRNAETLTMPSAAINPDEGTVEFWFNPRDKKPGQYSGLFTVGTYGTDGLTTPSLLVQWGTGYNSGNRIEVVIGNGSGGLLFRDVSLTILANTWHRVVARWSKSLNKTSLKVYDGTETVYADEGAYLATSPSFGSYPNVYIGQNQPNNEWTNAYIDDLRVSKVWRSDTDIERPFLPTTPLASSVDTLTTYRMGFDSDLTFGAGAQVPNVSADRGDASVTLSAADATTQRFNTTLTANRTVTLPSTSLTAGMYFDIVRQATGAFNLSVTDGTTTFANLTAPNQSARVAYTGSAWVLTWIPAWSGVSADRGNADVTLTMADAPIQRFNTQLTANRTVTLPTANQVVGSRFRIIRHAATQGAFTLTVQTMSPTNKVIANSTSGWVEAMWDGSNWQLIGSGVIGNTTSP